MMVYSGFSRMHTFHDEHVALDKQRWLQSGRWMAQLSAAAWEKGEAAHSNSTLGWYLRDSLHSGAPRGRDICAQRGAQFQEGKLLPDSVCRPNLPGVCSEPDAIERLMQHSRETLDAERCPYVSLAEYRMSSTVWALITPQERFRA